MSYQIFINVIIIFRNFWWFEKIEEAFTVFSFGNWLSILWTFLGLFLQHLLSQAFSRVPFNFRPIKKGSNQNLIYIKLNPLNNIVNSVNTLHNTTIPNCFLQYRFILINHMICFSQDRVWKVRIGIKKELKLESFRVIYPDPLNVF